MFIKKDSCHDKLLSLFIGINPLPILSKDCWDVWWLLANISSISGVSPKSITISLVSSVPFLLPEAHTRRLLSAFTLHTTPPEPPLSRDTKLRINSPVCRDHSFTVPSSEEVTTNLRVNCKHVTAPWCLCVPGNRNNHNIESQWHSKLELNIIGDFTKYWVNWELSNLRAREDWVV